MRTAIISIAVIIALGSAALAYYQNSMADRAVGDLNKERYDRMMAEEGLQKAEDQVSRLQGEIEALKTQLQNSEKLLKQAQSVNKDMQEKLDKAEAMKDALEKQMKNAGNTVLPSVPTATGDI